MNYRKKQRSQRNTTPIQSYYSKISDPTSINWFPGHMKKTSDLIKKLAKKVTAVVEILDARIPKSGRNPLIFEFTSELPRLIILNKCDIADPYITLQWKAYFQKHGFAVLSLSATNKLSRKDRKKARERVRQELQKLLNFPLTFTSMICGIPNVGKSTFINMITGGKKTKVGNRPGITMDKQLIKIEDDRPWALVDMPGLLMPKLNFQESFHLALCGTIKKGIYDETELACHFLKFYLSSSDSQTKIRYQKLIKNFDLSLNTDIPHPPGVDQEFFWLKEIAKRRGLILKNNEIDYSETAALVIREFRSGKLGRITLEKPEDYSS